MEFFLYTFIAFVFLFFPEGKEAGVTLALESVKNVVIATLFPMMVITRAISGSKVMFRIQKALAKCRIWQRLKLSPALITPVTLGIISGFPASARQIEKLLEEKRISDREALKALALSSAPSPAFVIGIVSKNAFHGIFIFTLTLILSYLIVCRAKSTPSKAENDFCQLTFPSALFSSVSSALTVSGNIIFFTLLLSLFSFLPQKAILIMSAFLELGSGSMMLSKKPLLLAFLTGWGGLSALCQIRSEAPKIKVNLYIKVRLLSALLLVVFEIILFCFKI